MKRILLLLSLLFLPVIAHGQTQIQSGPIDPVTCDPTQGQLWFNNSTVPAVLKYCSATNTWTAVGTGTGSTIFPWTTLSSTATPALTVNNGSVNYFMSVTGNVTAVTTTGLAPNGTYLGINFQEDGTGGRTIPTSAFPGNFVFPTGCKFNITANANNFFAWTYDGTNWQPVPGTCDNINLQTNGTPNGNQSVLNLAAGAGATLSDNGNGTVTISSATATTGAVGTIQKTDGSGNHVASNIVENNGVVTISDEQIPLGPNPYVDIRSYGARAVNGTSPPNTTGTITTGTNSLVVASATGFVKGDGVAIVGAGATQSMATPTAPTVTPSCAASLTGLGITVPAGTGATSYTYSLSMMDALRGYTAASTATTITNGNATLGSNNTAWTSSASGTSNTFTAQVGSTSNLAAGCVVFMTGSTDDQEFGGFKVVASIVDGTHFTYTSGVDAARGISATTATGGTVYYWLCNHITLPTPTAGGTQYLIYSSGSIRGISLPANLGYVDTGYNTWDDYGSPMSDNSLWPWWVPTTAPSQAVNDMLVTTITNISGTTFTLADNASNSVTTSPMQFDDAPAVTAAVAASNCFTNGCGGTIHFPAIPRATGASNSGWVLSSPLTVSVPSLYVDGIIYVHDTFKVNGAIYGTYADARSQAAFSFEPTARVQIISRGALPTLWVSTGINDINISFSSQNGGVGVFHTSQNSINMNNVGYADNGAIDYMGIAFYDYQDRTAPGFGGHVTNNSFALSPNQVTGSTSTPSWASKFNFQWDLMYNTWNRRGIFMAPPQTGLFGKIFMGQEIQGPIAPVVTIASLDSGNKGGSLTLENMWIDSAATPMLANLSSSSGSIGASINIINSNMPGANVTGAPLITGKPFDGTVNVLGATLANPTNVYKQLGQNRNINIFGTNNGNSLNPGIQVSALSQTTIAYSANHTLTPQEGVVIATASGITFTLPHALRGQGWDIYNFNTGGTITVNVDSGTLSGFGATGPVTVSNNTGIHVTCDGTNCEVNGGNGGGGGGSPGGLVNAIQSNNGAGGFQGTNSPTANGNYVVNYNVTANASVAPTITIPGVPINVQTGTTYTYLYSDRGSLITANNAGAQTYTLVNPSSAGFGSNWFGVLKNIGTGTVTDNASGFTINGGASLIVPPNWTRFLWSDGVNYTASRLPDYAAFPNCVGGGNALQFTSATGAFSCGSSSSGVASFTGDGALLNNSASTGAVTATLANAGAHKFWMNNTGISAAPGYQSAGEADLPATTVFTDKANTMGAFLFDLSAGTTKVPQGAAATAGATSNLILDTTNKNLHAYLNNADAILCGFASAPTTGDLVSVTVSSSNILCSDSNILATNAVTNSTGNAAAANQIIVSGGANKTVKAIDFPERYYVPAANCNNTTAGAGWSIGSGGTVTCRAGTNNKGGYIAITDTSTTFAQFTITIPEDWDTATNPYIRFYVASTDTTNGHTIIPAIQVSCGKGDGTTTDDVTFNAAHSSSTITLNTTASQFWSNSNVQMNSTDMTGCVGGALMIVSVQRATDTATNAQFYGADVTFPRLLTVGAE